MNTAHSEGGLRGFLGADPRSVQWLWARPLEEEEAGSAAGSGRDSGPPEGKLSAKCKYNGGGSYTRTLADLMAEAEEKGGV